MVSPSSGAERGLAAPLISCLCVTEGRPAFLPWLCWGFERQTWPHKELLIVDSSPPQALSHASHAAPSGAAEVLQARPTDRLSASINELAIFRPLGALTDAPGGLAPEAKRSVGGGGSRRAGNRFTPR